MDKNKTEKYGAPDNPYAYTVLQNLQDAGCADEMVEEFMALQENSFIERKSKLTALTIYSIRYRKRNEI